MGIEKFLYRDTTYQVRIVDDSFGLHRDEILLKGAEGEALAAVPVVWERLEYLSSVPRRVILGRASQRVFLRCPDLSVELAKILSTPKGVQATLSSPRELALSLSDDAPAIIEGVLLAETTAKGRPPLSIEVVRYAPREATAAGVERSARARPIASFGKAK